MGEVRGGGAGDAHAGVRAGHRRDDGRRERFPSQTDVLVAVRAERRERIASEMYAAMVLGNFVAYAVSNGSMSLDPDPEDALERADGLMAALDAAEARDREATK